ncbi:MAG: hypothetical protein SF187_13740 [Deltaproteobacteria bacterium]|nr:hypothetical protein [Deltaproteobacteria bacterium]
MNQTQQPARTRQVPWLWALIALVAVAIMAGTAEWARQRATRARSAWPAEADILYLPPAKALKVASLGHHELLADLLAARANIYFGDQVEKKGQHRWLAWYLNAVVELDPYFEPLYRRGAVMLMYSTSKVTFENVEAATTLLRRGLKIFPGSWELYFQLGFNLYYEMPGVVPADDKRIPGWKKEGIEALRHATLFDEVPPWYPTLVAGMLSKQGEREMAIKHLEQTYAATSDEETRANISAQLKRLIGEQFVSSFALQAAKLKIITSTRFPYAPEAFSLLTGRRFAPYARLRNTLVDPADDTADLSPAEPH